jgi:hypothetical protein
MLGECGCVPERTATAGWRFDIRPSRQTNTNTRSWRSAIRTLTLLATTPLEALNLPTTFAADPLAKPYFPRQVRSLMKVSVAQAATPAKNLSGGIVGEIFGSSELRPWFEQGAGRIGGEVQHGASVVHGDYKMDNLVSANRPAGVLFFSNDLDLPPHRAPRHRYPRLGAVYARLAAG